MPARRPIHPLAVPIALAGALSCSVAPDRAGPAPTSANTAMTPEDHAKRAIDDEIAKLWASAGVTPAPRASDVEFLRRVSLDLAGRPPTPDEAREFLADPKADKRDRAIDRLLADPGWAEHWAEVLLPTVIGTDDKAKRRLSEATSDWLQKELASGKSWDEITDALLTAEGSLEEQPAGAFVAGRGRDRDLAVLAGDTSRAFLGVQIECAQCHDHPYLDLTSEDFWGMAAFYARTRVRPRGKQKPPSFEVVDTRRGEARRPQDESSEMGAIRKRVVPPAFLGEPVTIGDDETRRQALSRLVRGSDLFAEAAVGRVWSEMFGRGIVEPWDDLGDTRDPPPLLVRLAEYFRAQDHDLRALMREIARSEAYQRSSRGGSGKGGVEPEIVFARAAIRPLDAEPLFRSLIHVTGIEQVDARQVRKLVQNQKNKAKREFSFVFGNDEPGAADSFTANVPQALLLLNGGLTNQSVVARPGGSLDGILRSTDDPKRRLEALTFTVYGRPPTDTEHEALRSMFANADAQTTAAAPWEDLMFAMLFSTEFTTNH